MLNIKKNNLSYVVLCAMWVSDCQRIYLSRREKYLLKYVNRIEMFFLDAIASLQLGMSVGRSVRPLTHFKAFKLSKHSSCQSIQTVKAFNLHSSCQSIKAVKAFKLSRQSGCQGSQAVKAFKLSKHSSCQSIQAVKAVKLSRQ